jgi:hypothetical protein
MSDRRRESAAPVEPYFDRTPQPFGDGPVDPLVYDTSLRALRQRTVNFAAKRLIDMRYVSRLDRTTAEWLLATGRNAGRPRLPGRARGPIRSCGCAAPSVELRSLGCCRYPRCPSLLTS